MRNQWKLIDWPTSLFLIGTLLLTVIAVPLYLIHFGLDWFQATMFLAFFIATGLSITLGYHRLFAHRSFQAAWPVRLLTIFFGAAAFENSVLRWAADHRVHHKYVDQEKDPYDISKGFFHAHIGWLLFRLHEPISFDYVRDLQQDRWIRWQDRYYVWVAIGAGFLLPTVLGFFWNGWAGALGGFLLAGVARTVMVQHFTFFINSFCHKVGSQPYSDRNTARDSAIMALFTFGEGYHNFHHAFQHDYRNGVQPWQFDPTKWSIWLLNRVGLARDLRRVPLERIQFAQAREQERRLTEKLQSKSLTLGAQLQAQLQAAQTRLHGAVELWEECQKQYSDALSRRREESVEKLAEMKRELTEARARFRAAIRDWQQTYRAVLSEAFAAA